MTRAIEPDDAARAALEKVLAKIEQAGLAIAAEHGADNSRGEAPGRPIPLPHVPWVRFREEGLEDAA